MKRTFAICLIFVVLTLGCAKKFDDMDKDEQIIYSLTYRKNPPFNGVEADWTTYCPSQGQAVSLGSFLAEHGYEIKDIQFEKSTTSWKVETKQIPIEGMNVKILRKHRKIIEAASADNVCGEVLCGLTMDEQPNKSLKDAP